MGTADFTHARIGSDPRVDQILSGRCGIYVRIMLDVGATAGMVYWIRGIPHASDPGSIPGATLGGQAGHYSTLQFRG